MALLRRAPAFIGLLVVGAVSWALINRPSDEAEWLQVEVPSQIVGGARMLVSLTLKRPLPRGFLGVDLHGLKKGGESRGVVSFARVVEIDDGQTDYRFSLPVPASPDLEAVFGVIAVSPTGNWSDRTRACITDPIEISPRIDPANAGKRHPIVAHDQPLGPAPARVDSQPVRWAAAVLWLLAGCLGWRLRLGAQRSIGEPPSPVSKRWAWLAGAAVLAAVWEASPADSVLGEVFRNFAKAHGYYDGRRGLQEILTALVIGVSIVFAILALRRDHAQPIAVVFTGADVYWCIAAVSFISLHDADAWLATPLWTIPVVQVVKLGAALVAVCGAARANLRS